MKKTGILFAFLILISSISTIGFSTVFNSDTSQTVKTPIMEAGSDSTLIDFERLAAEGNAQKSNQTSQEATPQKELVGEFKLTYYTPSSDETDNTPHITATGARVKPGITVAVDPRYYKLGTQFYIEGHGYVIAEDTGSKVKGPHAMDVSVATKDQAFKNGIQYRKVWIIKA